MSGYATKDGNTAGAPKRAIRAPTAPASQRARPGGVRAARRISPRENPRSSSFTSAPGEPIEHQGVEEAARHSETIDDGEVVGVGNLDDARLERRPRRGHGDALAMELAALQL